MTRRLVNAALAWSLVAGTACGPPQDDDPAKQEASVLSARAARLANALAHPDSGAERGKAEPVKGDFKSIAIVDDHIFLFTSKGNLYEFKQWADGAHVDYTTIDTGLRDVCKIEEMAWEVSSRSLLFACKDAKEKRLKDSLVIFRWKLDTEEARGLSLPRLTVPIAQVIGANRWDHVKPSDITVDPKSGNYVLVASKDKALIEITPDGLLIVSDEGPIGPAVITMYRRR